MSFEWMASCSTRGLIASNKVVLHLCRLLDVKNWRIKRFYMTLKTRLIPHLSRLLALNTIFHAHPNFLISRFGNMGQKAKRKVMQRQGPAKEPKTLESMHPKDETTVNVTGEGIQQEETLLNFDHDEFSSYFRGVEPKIIVTTSRRPDSDTVLFATELSGVFYNAIYASRQNHEMKQVLGEAIAGSYTDIIVVQERQRKPHSLALIHLPSGPTAYFRLTTVRPSASIKNHGVATEHPPELILNHFTTMLGVTVGRFLMSLFPPVPQFTGRQVVTFHNQRDFIFFRRHRYIFEDGARVRLQELGPRFTLKPLALQKGAFETKNGEFIWLRKKGMNTKKLFYL